MSGRWFDSDTLRRLVDHESFYWLPGMEVLDRSPRGFMRFRITKRTKSIRPSFPDAVPNLTDAATVGCLYQLVQDRHFDETKLWRGYVEVRRDHRELFFVRQFCHDEKGGLTEVHICQPGTTYVDALVNALFAERK